MKHENGFSSVALVCAVVVIGVTGLVGYQVYRSSNRSADKSSSAVTANKQPSIRSDSQESKETCAGDPVVDLPVDKNRVQAILYPGQVRGNNFKPHGGFRLTGGNNVNITLPLDAKVIDGVRYRESGEIQYMFDFQTECGYRIRLDHLHTLTSDMQKIAEQLPAPTEDSRTTNVSSVVIKKGTILATKVGFVNTGNSSFDFGFYDMNKLNQASQAADWPTDFQYTTELAKHGTCWFDYLSEKDEVFVRSLPGGDGVQGKNSVYCK